jgi:hypothetical protein
MQNPIASPAHARLATSMLERATRLPQGYHIALVMAEGTAIFLGHEKGGLAENKVLRLQRRLFKWGIEVTAFALSDNGLAWSLIGSMPPPGCKARELEAELDELLRGLRKKSSRRRRRQRGRSGKAPTRQKP